MRMPRVPVTVAMIQKIQAHLDLPENRIADSMCDLWIGERISPAGQVFARAELFDGQLKITAPGSAAGPMAKADLDARLLAMFRVGMELALRNAAARFPEIEPDAR